MNRQKPLKSQKKIKTFDGIIHVHPRGFGFINASDNPDLKQDVFIPKSAMGDAVDGDTVTVQLFPGKKEKGPEGQVLKIVRRERQTIVGIISHAHKKGNSFAYSQLLGRKYQIDVKPNKKKPLKFGDRILLNVIKWGNKETPTLCSVNKFLGNIRDAGKDIDVAVEEYGLSKTFPKKAIKEADQFSSRVTKKDLKNRIDLRHITCFTIDPDTAKDFDDAISIEKDKLGRFKLGVHIADAAHFVRPGSELDKEARIRLNSTYFPGCCLPMLPPSLSENLLSLRPSVLRLTVSIQFVIDKDGNTLSYDIKRSVIRSRKRFTYKQAKAVLDGKVKSPYKKNLKELEELCFALKKQRTARGCVEFAIPDLEVRINDEGKPTTTEFVPYDITHQMIEECMLKANETIATHLSKHGAKLPYRVHDEPDKVAMQEFSLVANGFGFSLPEDPTQEQLQQLFDEALQTPHGHFLAIRYIRSMKMAQYHPDNIGHYGLGLSHYCHFTSPIRRYTDLIIHRLIHGEDTGIDNLISYSEDSNEKERNSQRAEMQVMRLKKLRLLHQWGQEDKNRTYTAAVTQLKHFGLFFELKELLLEGFLPLRALESDDWFFDPKSSSLKGASTCRSYQIGSEIKVQLKHIDFISGEIDWYLKQ